jgi:hypothetical protein
MVEFDGTITSITGKANGVTIGTVTDHIPDGANKVGPWFKIQAMGTGTTSKVLTLDACQFYIERDQDR